MMINGRTITRQGISKTRMTAYSLFIRENRQLVFYEKLAIKILRGGLRVIGIGLYFIAAIFLSGMNYAALSGSSSLLLHELQPTIIEKLEYLFYIPMAQGFLHFGFGGTIGVVFILLAITTNLFKEWKIPLGIVLLSAVALSLFMTLSVFYLLSSPEMLKSMPAHLQRPFMVDYTTGGITTITLAVVGAILIRPKALKILRITLYTVGCFFLSSMNSKLYFHFPLVAAVVPTPVTGKLETTLLYGIVGLSSIFFAMSINRFQDWRLPLGIVLLAATGLTVRDLFQSGYSTVKSQAILNSMGIHIKLLPCYIDSYVFGSIFTIAFLIIGIVLVLPSCRNNFFSTKN